MIFSKKKFRFFCIVHLLFISTLPSFTFSSDVDQKVIELNQLASDIKAELEKKSNRIKKQLEQKVPLFVEPFNVEHFTKLQNFSEYFTLVSKGWKEIGYGAVKIVIQAIDDIDLVQPRYSKKYNDLIYSAYGSADFKDSTEFKSSIEGQAIYNKNGRTWSEWWHGPTDEDMAYPDKSKDPFIQPMGDNSNK